MFEAQFGTTCMPASSSTKMSPPPTNDGASFTGVTLTLRETMLLPFACESVIWKEMVLVSDAGFSDRLSYCTDRNAAWYCASDAPPEMAKVPVLASKTPVRPACEVNFRTSSPGLKLLVIVIRAPLIGFPLGLLMVSELVTVTGWFSRKGRVVASMPDSPGGISLP